MAYIYSCHTLKSAHYRLNYSKKHSLDCQNTLIMKEMERVGRYIKNICLFRVHKKRIQMMRQKLISIIERLLSRDTALCVCYLGLTCRAYSLSVSHPSSRVSHLSSAYHNQFEGLGIIFGRVQLIIEDLHPATSKMHHQTFPPPQT